jgi:hypothetical protein
MAVGDLNCNSVVFQLLSVDTIGETPFLNTAFKLEGGFSFPAWLGCGVEQLGWLT